MKATQVPPPTLLISNSVNQGSDSVKSMSKGFNHQDINISFSHDQNHQRQHIAQQSRRDKLRVQGFEPPPSLVAIEAEEEPVGMPVYETGGMWSDMFNFQSGAASTSSEFLENQISSNYRLQREEAAAQPVGVANEWYGNRQGIVDGLGMGPLGDSKQQPNSDNRDSSFAAQNHQISSLNADSAAAMQLFLMNPQPRSPSPTPTPPPHSSSTPLHLLLPHQSTSHPFHSTATGLGNSTIQPSHFQWASSSSRPSTGTQLNKIGTALENQGNLSLTLSSSLQHLGAAKAEEFRMGEDGIFYFDQGSGTTSTSPGFHLKNYGSYNQNQTMHLQGVGVGMGQNSLIGLRSSVGVVSLLRNSKYVKAAQELLEEFCSVGRGHLKNNRSLGRQNSNLNPNQASGCGNGGSSSSSKDLPPLSAADKIDYQRKKTKLLSMLDEVDRRYNHYCEQMQVVVNSFDSVMGFGSATPYTALAQKAMSRHFRCLKDAITTQLRQTCELLGDKDSAGGSGVTKGETPRLKLLEQSLRQQRAFHQMGMMEQEAWRPQRGLPERSVNILRAWLFEHFLHPYPSDADKHLLARQTGLSRNQVSNWFINARVRLWKPMVEEMYQQEAKDEEVDEDERESNQTNSNAAQTPMPSTITTTTQPESTATSLTTTITAGKRSQINDMDNDPSLYAINTQCFSENQAIHITPTTTTTTTTSMSHCDVSPFATLQSDAPHLGIDDPCQVGGIIGSDYRTTAVNADMASTLVRFGTTMGDVSLTLGLRHAGNLPEKSHYSVRDFGGC